MAVTAFWYAKAIIAMLNNPDLDWDTNTINVMLTTSAYTPNQDTHDFKNDVTNEVVGTGYSAGGNPITGKTLSNTNNVVTGDGNDVSWPTSTITARRAVAYDNSGATDAAKCLLFWIDFGQDESSSNGTFTIQWNASGIFQFTVADAAGFP